MIKSVILTTEGKKKLVAELHDLINVERPQVIEEIKIARAQGDLSENAEFDAAREKQGQTEDRISEIEKILDSAKIISKIASNNAGVRLGTKVEIQDLRDNTKRTFKIVGTLEADPFEGLISNQSPLAKAILGKSKGEVVLVETKAKYEVKITKILK